MRRSTHSRSFICLYLEKAAIQVTREESSAVAAGMVKMFYISVLIIIGIMAFAGALICWRKETHWIKGAHVLGFH